MGLNDLPIVDIAAENSELSVNSLKAQFQQKFGFIAREDIPDKGCDFLVEIVSNNRATNWRFPIQLKSIEKLKLIKKGKYISYPFELSRLNYLLNYKPIVGIVVLYSVANGKLYFDYIDKIYYRLKDSHKNNQWRDKKEVNIHIPLENIIDIDSRQDIHSYMLNAFTNNEVMYTDHALDYNLPVIEPRIQKDLPTTLVEKAEQALRDYGLHLLNQMDIVFLDELLSALPNQNIVSDSKIALVAAMTYHEMGLYVDAEYFLSKVLHRKGVPEDLILSAKWTKIKNDFYLSKIGREEFIASVTNLRDSLTEDEVYNRVLFDLNLAHHQSMGVSPFSPLPPEIESSFDNYVLKIENLQASEAQKNFLQLMNASNYSMFILRMNDLLLNVFDSREISGEEVPLRERRLSVQFIFELYSKFKKSVLSIYKKAKENDNELLQGESLIILCDTSLSLEFNMLRPGRAIDLDFREEHGQQLNHHVNTAANAVNHYFKAGYLDRAYHSLCTALEFIYILQYYELPTAFDINELSRLKDELQEKLQAPDYKFQSLNLIKRMQSQSMPG
jgi:hypothetical protein